MCAILHYLGIVFGVSLVLCFMFVPAVVVVAMVGLILVAVIVVVVVWVIAMVNVFCGVVAVGVILVPLYHCVRWLVCMFLSLLCFT